MTELSGEKRWNRYKEAVKIANTILPDNRRVLFNVLHYPFPNEGATCLKAHCATKDTPILQEYSSTKQLGSLANLPLEVLELILTRLPVPGIDAARFTCRSWYKMIMASSYILESLVKLRNITAPKEAKDDRLRQLQRQLDQDADLVKYPAEKDPWRVRYRLCKIDFRLPPTAECLHEVTCLPDRANGARFCIDGTPIGALITKPIRVSCADSSRNLVLYQFCLSARPRYIGLIKLPDSSDYINIHSTAVAGRSEAWNISLGLSDRIEYYRVESNKAYSIEGPAYKLELLKDMPDSASSIPVNISTQGEVVWTTAGSQGTKWFLLGSLPRIDGSQAGSEVGSRPPVNLFQVAKHGKSEHLYILRLRDETYTGNEEHVSDLQKDESMMVNQANSTDGPIPVAKLLSPNEHCEYRNIAIGSLQAMDATAQVAVIWQDTLEVDRRPELYVYEIPGSLWRSFRDIHSMQESIYSIQTHIRNLECCVEIQAKRVRSLDPGIGGIHMTSPLRNRQKGYVENASWDASDNLGGLKILQTRWNMDCPRYRTRNRQGLYIYVWGSSASGNDRIVLNVFDMSYSNPFLATFPQHSRTFGHFAKIDPHLLDSYYYGSHGVVCQCALHDDGYHVELPGRPRARTTEDSKARWWSFSGSTDSKATPVPDCGLIEHYYSTAAQAALERKEEWMREQVRKWKRAGMTDDMVIEAWYSRRWTFNGICGLPEDWKNLTV